MLKFELSDGYTFEGESMEDLRDAMDSYVSCEKERIEEIETFLNDSSDEPIDQDAYNDAAYLSFHDVPMNDEGEWDENGEHADSLEEAMIRDGDLQFPNIPDGEYPVVAYHHIEQKKAADKEVGFTKTKWVAAEDVKFTKQSEDPALQRLERMSIERRLLSGWGYSYASELVSVKDSKVSSNVAELAMEAHARSGYWGTFYEGLEFDEDLQAFKVLVGS